MRRSSARNTRGSSTTTSAGKRWANSPSGARSRSSGADRSEPRRRHGLHQELQLRRTARRAAAAELPQPELDVVEAQPRDGAADRLHRLSTRPTVAGRAARLAASARLSDAGEGTRTPKGFRPPAPKAGVSTNSTTPARGAGRDCMVMQRCLRLQAGSRASSTAPGVIDHASQPRQGGRAGDARDGDRAAARQRRAGR